MKRLLPGVLLAFVSLSLFGGAREAQWKKVQEAISRGLPQTAITNLEPIIREALHDRAYAEAVKAIGKKIALQGNIQGNKPEEKITRLEAELAKAPQEMAPVLQTLLAHWYWHYFQQNRWRFLQRTATAQAPGADFTTWDLPRLFAEIDRHFQQALGAEKALKATPVAAWDDLLAKGTMPDSCRPTLYDFIAHEALAFYTAGEQAGARPEDVFEVPADSPLLGPADKFIGWEPAPGVAPQGERPAGKAAGKMGAFSPVLRAIQLYQALLRFHHNEPPPQLAFAEADLERLTWGWNTAFGEDKNARYKAALEAFIRKYGDFEIATLAYERQGRVLQQEGDLVAAHNLAQRGAQLFPQSPGGKLCRNLVTELKAKSASITTERVWNGFDISGAALPPAAAGVSPANQAPAAGRHAAGPVITVRYRNVQAVYFRAIPYDWEVFLDKRHHRPEYLSDQERRAILAKAPVLEWSEKLPPTKDYKEETYAAPAPDRLKPGFYFIAASHNPGFGEADNIVSMTEVWVSELALVTRQRHGDLEGFVWEAGSGEPVAEATVSVWHLDNQGNRVADPSLTTDENGFFAVKQPARGAYLFRVRDAKGRELATAGDVPVYDWQRQQPERPAPQTIFFTDRALYRPGQLIQYKGICLWVDQARDNYEVLKGEEVTVLFKDPNGKEIARRKQRANDYGSLAGSFTAPRDRALGQMCLEAEGRARGTAAFRVEEYKRPKFEVTLDAPKTAAKLNQKLSLTGHALSYTGAAVDGAPVQYRVVREVRLPRWWGLWRGRWMQNQSQVIAHGTTRTEVDGSFQIEFAARPDPKVPEQQEPTFVFSVNADVTDSAGETRSAERGINVGYTALAATMSAADWQTDDQPVELKLQTTTLDGEPQVAEGSVKIYHLQAPDQVQRAPLPGEDYSAYRGGGAEEEAADMSDPNHWPLAKVAAEKAFTTDTNGAAKMAFKLDAGAYRAVLETQDRFGKKVTGRLPLLVLKPDATRLALKLPHLLAARDWEVQPGQEFLALWGTGYDAGRAFIEIERRHQMLQRYWTRPGRTQQQVKLAVTEAMRGGFTLHVTQVRQNRAYHESRRVSVPWKNKELDLKWEHFVSKLQPGQKETWTVVVAGPKAQLQSPKAQVRTAERVVAEMVAALYDESLDAFARHDWLHRFNIFHEDQSDAQTQFGNVLKGFEHVLGQWNPHYEDVTITYRSFPPDLTQNLWGYAYFTRRYGLARQRGVAEEAIDELAPVQTAALGVPTALALDKAAPAREVRLGRFSLNGPLAGGAKFSPQGAGLPPPSAAGQPAGPKPDLGQVAARKNLNETAFFFPQLTSDSNGLVRITFTMPEALTKWRFLGFAHDHSVRSGYLEGHAVTAKDLMVQPNPPRFLREGDTVEFTVKVSNQSDTPQAGTVRLTFNDLLSSGAGLPPAAVPSKTDKLLGNTKPERPFDLPPKQSRSFAWRIQVPDGCGFLAYKAVGAAAKVSDGEEGALPVLSRRILVTESLPLPIRGPATRKFEFTKLLKSGSSKTLRNQSLTVQMVSNPAWYAVLALPYLMEFPHECTEQTFNRLYANALARFIANSDPKLRRIFDQWKNTPALDSPLDKNQDLKAVMIEETPWLRQAQAESQARRNVGILFDDNRLNYEMEATLRKLAQMQFADGSWPWFPGGPRSDYITLYITTGFGRLRHLGVDIQVAPALRSLQRLDAWMTEEYERIQKASSPELYVPSATDALYLYGRSFFLKDLPIAPAHKPAAEFFLQQARKFWLKTNCRQTQGHLAIALKRFAAFNALNDSTPKDILNSLKERSVTNEEMGRFWRDTELSWWWYRAPIETQALMLEAFDEVLGDLPAVEECRVWLLKQKQTQDWKTTKATADAVYGLLLRGKDILSSDALVQVKLDGIDVTAQVRSPKSEVRESPEASKSEVRSRPEPGTGFYEVRFPAADIKPGLGEITVKKVDAGVAWGSVHWQYLEDMTKVTPYAGTPLKLKKALFTKKATGAGQVLEPVKGPVRVGDELVVRVELRVDRDMEYVHLKDQRGSGTEPVNVLSGYRYQDGLAYYESTRDTASHFFIDYLPKGTYVFEYSTRVQLRGDYQTGVAQIQCMYAPEFNSHSQSLPLVVK